MELSPQEKSPKKKLGNSKPKLPPTTAEQKTAMLDFMMMHRHHARGRIPGKNANKAMQIMHQRIAAVLNIDKGVLEGTHLFI